MRRVIVPTLGALVLTLASFGAGDARAQQLGAPDPLVQAVQAAIQVNRVNARVSEVTQQLAEVRTRLAALTPALQDIADRYGKTSDELRAARTKLDLKAAASYRVNGGQLDAVFRLKRSQALNVANKYAQTATVADASDVERLSTLLTELGRERDATLAALNTLSDQMTKLNQLDLQLRDEAMRAQAELERVGGVSVMGEPRLTVQQMTDWFVSTGHQANLPLGTTVGDLVQMFFEEGAAEHVRSDLAFAQAVLETGFLRATRGNNYSGIGNCDSCGGQGKMFPTPRDGVRAQIQLLRSYADGLSRAENLSHPLDPTLFGANPVSAIANYNRFFLKGKVPLWNQMGNGNWATSTTYAANVLGIYARMLAFAGIA